MEENPSTPQELHPCPICHRKFLKDRLEVHLRSCDKSNKYSHGGGYDNSAFLKKLDSELAKEEQNSTYKSSKKEKENPNKAFVDKLDAEMAKEEQNSSYKPYQPKKKEVVDSNKAFMDKLDAEMKKEEQNPTYHKTNKPKKPSSKEINQNDFLAKVEQEMEKDKKNPYVPYAQQKKKNAPPEPQDYNKAFLEKLDAEMKNTEKYKPSDKPKKPAQHAGRGNNYSKKDFEDKINAEMEKEKNASSSGAGNNKGGKDIMCYICYKTYPATTYASHVKSCQTTWQRNNIGKDINCLKPEKLDEILKHPSTLKPEQIQEFNESIMKNKDKMTFVPCENCARNIILWKMEEHLKTCKPMAHSVRGSGSHPAQGNFQVDINKMMEEDQNKYPQVELIPCELCGRKLLPERMDAHKRACKGKK